MGSESRGYDVVIIGGGPAGLSAALWCDELGLSTLLLEKESEYGGQLNRVYNPISNHLGIEAANGPELRDRFIAQTANRGFDRMSDSYVSAINAPRKSVTLKNGKEFQAGVLIVATGTRRRRSGAAGENEFKGRGVIESGKKDGEEVKGKRALIVGGGDAAVENALILAEYAAKVFVAHRREEFTARDEFLERARNDRKIEFLTSRVLESIEGRDRVESVRLRDTLSGEIARIPVDTVLIRIGVEPNTGFLKGCLGMDGQGYIIVDSGGKTSEEGVFAIGDVANPTASTVSSAVGSGATAARAAYEYLVHSKRL